MVFHLFSLQKRPRSKIKIIKVIIATSTNSTSYLNMRKSIKNPFITSTIKLAVRSSSHSESAWVP